MAGILPLAGFIAAACPLASTGYTASPETMRAKGSFDVTVNPLVNPEPTSREDVLHFDIEIP